MTKSRGIRAPRAEWSRAELDRLAELYPDTRTAKIADELGKTVGQVFSKAAALGLKKSAAYLASPDACRLRRGDEVGKSYRFTPGHVPANKGKKGLPSVGRMAETQFKPGAKPHTWKPIGSDRLSKEGYLQVKLYDTGCTRRDFIPVHHLVWELHRGAIPNGYRVTFRDRDKTRIVIENLELVSIADMMKRNSFHTNYPKEVGLAIQLRAALNRKINRIEKESDEQRDHS
jgi:hypothetical protein